MKRFNPAIFTALVCILMMGCSAATSVNIDGVSTVQAASSTAVTYASDELHKAANQGDIDQVKAILSTKVDVDARDSFGGTALHAAMFQNNIEIVKMLIDYGFDVNAQGTSNGYTPLHDSVWADNLPAAKLLIENGADPSIQNNEGQTPAEKAETEGKQELYQYLCQFKQGK